MTKSKHRNAQNRERRLVAAFMKAHRISHYSKPRRANDARQDKAMFANAAPKCDCSNDHCETEADLVNDWLAQQAACRREEAKQNGGRYAMDRAKA